MGKTTKVLALLLSCFVVVATFFRLRFGVDFTDEAFALAIPYRFLLGDKPFVDDWTLNQTVGLFLYPMVRAYRAATGGIEGLILFSRYIYFALSASLAAVAYFTFRSQLGWALALLIAASYLAFIPFQIPNLNYYSLGVGLYSAGILFALPSVLSEEKNKKPLVCGVLHGFAAIAHPALSLAVLFYLACLSAKEFRRLALPYFIGVIVVATPALIYFAGNFSAVHHVFLFTLNKYSVSPEYRLGSQIFFRYMGQLLYTGITPLLVISSWLLLPLLRRRAMIVILPLMTIATHLVAMMHLPVVIDGIGRHFYLLYLALVAPCLLFFLFLRSSKEEFNFAKSLFAFVWVPSVFAGLVLSAVSNNGLVLVGVAGLPAITTGVVFLWLVVGPTGNRELIAPFSFASLTLVILLLFQLFPHKNGRIENLDSQVEEGPYKGLYTTRFKREYLKKISYDLKMVAKPDRHVLFYFQFPAGYLLSEMKPSTPSLWTTCIRADRSECIEYYKRRMKVGDVVVRMRSNFFRNQLEVAEEFSDPHEPLDTLITETHKRVNARGWYEIYLATN